MIQRCSLQEIQATECVYLNETTSMETPETLLNGFLVVKCKVTKLQSREFALEKVLMKMNRIKFDCSQLEEIDDSTNMM